MVRENLLNNRDHGDFTGLFRHAADSVGVPVQSADFFVQNLQSPQICVRFSQKEIPLPGQCLFVFRSADLCV